MRRRTLLCSVILSILVCFSLSHQGIAYPIGDIVEFPSVWKFPVELWNLSKETIRQYELGKTVYHEEDNAIAYITHYDGIPVIVGYFFKQDHLYLVGVLIVYDTTITPQVILTRSHTIQNSLNEIYGEPSGGSQNHTQWETKDVTVTHGLGHNTQGQLMHIVQYMTIDTELLSLQSQ